jgi:predicted RNA-binding Zn-ribbon protein involved in translation (DUF1610 family)
MSKGLRLTEKWMRRALWLVAFLFAGFLIGLGSQVVDNLAYLGPVPDADSFIEPNKLAAIKAEIQAADRASETAGRAQDQAEHAHEVAAANTTSARKAFENWVATRQVTVRPDQDSELIERTRALDKLVEAERVALAAVEVQQKAKLDAEQDKARADGAYQALLRPAEQQAYAVALKAARKVFLFRLGVTLPLLIVAGWLFKYKRNGTYWPFTWGFIFFALFAFFVELVPYLPSYGGYVRYGVGIVLTVLGGRYAIRWLQGWIERQKAAEALPDQQRRTGMRYDVAMQRIGKNVCPSCERATNFEDETLGHCPHCGIGLFDRCPACRSRKNAFARFCFSCGTPANASLAD